MECPADSTWLRLLGVIGVERFVASSGFGYDFVCHVGDIAEFSGPVVINYSTKSCEREQLEKQKGGRVPRE